MRNPGTAAVLSAVIPGIGQFYNGDFLRAKRKNLETA
jgi:TM2 domain-containing membrane protein YozV